MKPILSSLSLATFLIFASSPVAQAVQLNFNSTGGSKIAFSGAPGTFSFTNSATTPTFGATGFMFPDLSGVVGRITGTFTIGTITGTPPNLDAPVTGRGLLEFWDGSTTLSATINMISIASDTGAGQTNANQVTNLTGISYAGTNPDLLAWMGENGHMANFNWSGATAAISLTSLTTGSAKTVSYSGNLLSTPEGGSSMVILGLSLLGIAAVRSKIKVA